MIKSSELRIGNWISNGEKHYTVEINMLWDICAGEFNGHPMPFDPIPLTPDILIACGFTNAYSAFHDARFIYNLKTDTLQFQWDSDYDAIIVSNAYQEEGMMFGCKCLHQLQNLYFALTGKEIEYNPK